MRLKKNYNSPMKCTKVISFSIFLLTATQVQAIEFEDAIFPELATSARALAMGNAYLAKSDDASAAFYNPAGLGTVRYPHLHLSNFHLELNKGWIDSSGGGKATDVPSNLIKGFSLDGQRELLKDKPGLISHSRLHAIPNFTARYFSMGYLFSKRIRSTVTDSNSATGFEYADRLDHGPYAALNISLFGGVFKAGVSGIMLSRSETFGSANPQATLDVPDSQYKKGTGFVVTGGAKLTLPVTFLPTFAVTMHNMADKGFSMGVRGAGEPDKIKPAVDVGFSITPQIGQSTRIHLEANYKDLNKEFPDISTNRKILLGMELDFARTFFMRFGYGDGFGSAGLGIKHRKLEFDLTTYAVDTTTSSFRGKEDRRFAMSFSSGF